METVYDLVDRIMLNSETVYDLVDRILANSKLKSLDEDLNAAAPLKGQLRTLLKELRFVKTYNLCLLTSKAFLGCDSDESKTVIISIKKALCESFKDIMDDSADDYVVQVSSGVSRLLEKVQGLKPEIREAWSGIMFNQYSRRPFIVWAKIYFFKIFASVKLNLEDLIDSQRLNVEMKRKIKVLENYLKFVEDIWLHLLAGYAHNTRGLGYVHFATSNIACLCYLFWDGMDDNVAGGMHIKPSDFLQKMKPHNPELMNMLVGLLKSLKAQEPRNAKNVNYVLVVSFVNFLLLDSLDSIHEHTETIHGDLIFLLRFIINLRDDCSEDLKQIAADIEAVAREAAIFKHKFCFNEVKEDQIREMNCISPWFLEKVRLIKAEIFLVQLSDSRDNWTVLVEDKIVALHEGLKYLRTIFVDPPKWQTEDYKLFLMLVGMVSSKVLSLTCSIQISRVPKEMVRKVNLDIFWMLENIKLIRAQINLMELQNNEANLMVHKKENIETLHDGLNFLRAFLFDIIDIDENAEDGKLLLTYLEAVLDESLPLNSSFHVNKVSEDIVGEFLKKSEVVTNEAESLNSSHIGGAKKMNRVMLINMFCSELLQKFKIFKVQIKQIYVRVGKSLQSNLPKTDGLGFISSLLGNLGELLSQKADFVAPLKHQLELIYAELEFLKSFLQDTAKQHKESKELKDIWTCITDTAYEVEYVMESLVLRDGPVLYHMLWLSVITEEMKLVKKMVLEYYDKNDFDVAIHSAAETSSHVPSLPSIITIDEVVGFNDEAMKIIDRLTRGTKQMDIVSIFGMPGMGKTTLARSVFNDSSVTYYFHIRAWCCVSQVYQKRDLLLYILADIIEVTDKVRKMSDDDIAQVLYKCLKGKRYLIVMDDMWNIGAWDDLRSSFPNDNNGSRVLFTSRLRDVALKAKPDCDPHPLRLLSEEESWELLQKKLSFKEGLPPTLLEVGKKISINCKGLPLAIVVIAGVLARTEKKVICWRQVSENLGSHIVADPEKKCMPILELSYKNLPDHLKSCFLYFGAFPEDKEIPVQKLLWLWIAEGFLYKTDSKSLEDAAEDYLLDLIGRSLVTVAKRGSNGHIKSCRVHDLLRDLCIEKAAKEKFLQQVHGYDKLFVASPDCLNYGFDYDCYASTSLPYQQRRLFICSKRKHFAMLKPCGSRVHCLLFLASSDARPRWPYDISFICQNFKVLRILDLETINMGTSFPTELHLLVNLRYLAVRGEINCIPSSIGNLWNLEIFLVKGLRGEIAVPDSFWNMKRLRHVHINDRAVWSLLDGKFKSHFQLHSIDTLSTPVLAYGKDSEKMMRKLPRLRKLKCIFMESSDSLGKFDKFPVLDFLTHLESLKIFYHGKVRYPCEFNFPSNLKKLSLSKFCLPWNAISTIGKLPNLEVLKLHLRAYEGQTWEMREGEFLKLKFLKLDSLNIAQWNASSDHLPCLQHLVLRSCKRLQQVPLDFSDIPTLQMIEVYWCNDSVADSVKQIQEEQISMGNEELKVLISAMGK